jgi:predicted TIM-barrel fold metal-dependent hydrolase
MEDRGPALPAELVDHNALVGPYPFRRLPDPTPERLLAELTRLGISRAWVGHVPSIYYRDVAAGNDELFRLLEPHRPRLLPVPAANPAYPGWEREVARARAERCPAVRTYPAHYGFAAAGREMRALASACADAGLELVLTVRLEDGRQRHHLDVAAELLGAEVRAAVRSHPAVRLLVTNAGRGLVEEVHFGATPAEAARIRWDIAWLWGPPDDQLAALYRTVGRDRFVLGTHFPFRLVEAGLTKLELADLDESAGAPVAR